LLQTFALDHKEIAEQCLKDGRTFSARIDTMDVTLDKTSFAKLPERALYVLLTLIVLLVALHSVTNYCWVTQACGGGTAAANDFGYLFNLNGETNLPTWFSIAILLLISLLALLIALHCQHMGQPSVAWWGLTFIFLLLSLDEGSDLHGLLRRLVTKPEAFGLLNHYFSWVIPAAAIVSVVAAVYGLWIFRLPKRTRWLIICAGTLYVGGALVLEAVGGVIVDETYLKPDYLLVSTLEETFEMTGAVVMIYALLDYARQRGVSFSF